jgi:hypothetical protein
MLTQFPTLPQDFVNGVIKVQSNLESLLLDKEVEALKPFLKKAPPAPAPALEEPTDMTDDEDSTPAPKYLSLNELRMKDEQKEKELKANGGSNYVNGIHAVGGTASMVETAWSMADNFYTKRRSSMSPLLFELIMCLKWNRSLWTMQDVAEANRRRKNEAKEKVSDSMMKRLAEDCAEIRKHNQLIPNDDDGAETDCEE